MNGKIPNKDGNYFDRLKDVAESVEGDSIALQNTDVVGQHLVAQLVYRYGETFLQQFQNLTQNYISRKARYAYFWKDFAGVARIWKSIQINATKDR